MPINPMLRKDRNNNKRQQYDSLYVLTSPIDTNNKLVIDIKDVISFCFCPRFYKYFKRNNVINLRTLYDLSIHNTIYNYLYALQNDRLKSTIEFLKYQWGKSWISFRKNSLKDVLIEASSFNADTFENKRKKGIDAIFRFEEIMSKDRQLPLVVDHKYEIEILPNIILTGSIEYVRELTVEDNKIIQVIKFVPEINQFVTHMQLKYNLELIAMSYAFEKLFTTKNFQPVTINIENGKIDTEFYTEKEYNILKETVKSVIMCIQNDINCVSPNKQCYHCEYRNTCMKDF